MTAKKTTREIIGGALAGKQRTPLYSAEAINKLKNQFESWKNEKVQAKDQENWNVIPQTVLGSELPRQLLYTPLNTADFDYMEDIGNSGQEPFARGIHSNMYRGRTFTQRQLVGFGKPEDSNARIKFLLEAGATGVNLLFDMPTIQMYDSDDPMSAGQVGSCGVCIDIAPDWERLFAGVDIAKETVSIVTHLPSNCCILFPMYLVLAERTNVPWDQLKGSVQNDVTMESCVRNAEVYIPPKDNFRVECDNIEFIRTNVPKWNFVTLNGYNLREFGTSGVTEMAVAFSHAMAILDEMIARGHDVDWVGERIAYFWSPAMDFFEEISRLRAARRLWYRIMKYKYNAKNPRSMLMRCHVQTSGISLVREEPLNNIIRSAYEALAAVLGGAQSLHVDSYDEAFAVPSEESSLLSLRNQQIIEHETGVTSVVDPLGGSYYVEALTNEIEQKILDEITEIENQGGYIEAIANGYLLNKIYNYFYNEQKKLETGEIKIVAHNWQKSLSGEDFEAFQYPEDAEVTQIARLKEHRAARDQAKVDKALKDLLEACQTKGVNIMAYTLECARVGCTVGEQWKVFKEAFGIWNRPSLI
ncbi:MAG: acyl-CoA mutase large subunit family protein [Desulfitobacteriaceae bacterium]|nr:acyl-CoA mutase large subunit family protein [Desulfitobacteriaceae bacterium]MDD2234663.1 acyl-CoA mutase large subunit family protein [Desulfitobacteriaceae bacterium]MDD4346434.1 acyl-CoA mutase large subunit family protein [Desulfitobacteriaceae bacterium]MDD4346436.1 acyl-CoA mutase large subunit family protein [Desulfitobacteriaceae bacterium]